MSEESIADLVKRKQLRVMTTRPGGRLRYYVESMQKIVEGKRGHTIKSGMHPLRPRSIFSRRAALMRWTGWTEGDIACLVRAKRLEVITTGKLLYHVESAREILDDKSGQNWAASLVELQRAATLVREKRRQK
jgi:hypothetical protein